MQQRLPAPVDRHRRAPRSLIAQLLRMKNKQIVRFIISPLIFRLFRTCQQSPSTTEANVAGISIYNVVG